jgi:hypothetical protein
MQKPFVTKHGIARRIGITARRVTQLVEHGVIPDAPRITAGRTLLFHWPSVKLALDRAGIPLLEHPAPIWEMKR